MTLKNNLWTFELLAQPIRQKMKDAVLAWPSEIISSTYLSSQLYKLGGRNSDLERAKPRMLDVGHSKSRSSAFFTEQIDRIFKVGKLETNEATIKKAKIWIKELKDFCNVHAKYQPLLNFLEYAIMLESVNFRGASHPHLLSSLFLHLDPTETKFNFLVSIIHESAHQELFLINFFDRLVNAKFDHNLIHAPYQNKNRPPIGRPHSLHALFRMIQFTSTFEPSNLDFDFFKTKFKRNLDSFNAGELTEFGCYLMGEVYEPFSKSL